MNYKFFDIKNLKYLFFLVIPVLIIFFIYIPFIFYKKLILFKSSKKHHLFQTRLNYGYMYFEY